MKRKSKKSETMCAIYYSDNRYKQMAECAINSFDFFHSNIVDSYLISPDNFYKIPNFQLTNELSHGYKKFGLALGLAKLHNYKKLIILGADTITCAKLEEFLKGRESCIATLGGYRIDTPHMQLGISTENRPHFVVPKLYDKKEKKFFSNRVAELPDLEEGITLNADVVCFNDLKLLDDMIKFGTMFENPAKRHQAGVLANSFTLFYEQGVLNFAFHQVVIGKDKRYTFNLPELETDCFYNNRSTITKEADFAGKPYDKEYIQKFYVENDSLFTEDKKQIKVFHYCQALGTRTVEEFKEFVDLWTAKVFNKETKSFFSSHGCGEFFQRKYFIK